MIAGDQRFVHFATILEDQRPLTGYAARLSPYVDNASWNERIALNAYLLGPGSPEFEAEQRHDLEDDDWGPWARDPAAAGRAAREAAGGLPRGRSDCRPALNRYDVRYIALPAGRGLPAAIRSRLETGQGRDRPGTSSAGGRTGAGGRRHRRR